MRTALNGRSPWSGIRPSCFALPTTVEVQIEGRSVAVQAWQYDVLGITGYTVPLLLLGTDCEGNAPLDRELTSSLYGGDERYRLAQEIILGVGGLRMLRALGYSELERFHMNEGHASLLALDLYGNANSRNKQNGISTRSDGAVSLPPIHRFQPDMTSFPTN